MEKEFNMKRYSGFIKVVDVILTIIKIFFIVVVSIVGVGFLASVAIPHDVLNIDLTRFKDLDYPMIAVMNSFDSAFFDQTVNVKRLLMLFTFAGVLNLVFILFIIIQLKKLVRNVKDESPFNVRNSIILRNLGIGYFVAAVFVSIVNGLVRASAINTFNIAQLDYKFNINWQYVFMGVLILVLGYVFSYGSYLQEEHDQTV